MQQQNMFLAWLQENIQRLFIKSPKFFQIWTWFFGLVTAISGLTAFIQMLGVHLVSPFDVVADKAIWISGLIGTAMSKLTTQSTIVAGKEGEAPLKQTDSKLVFTTNTEINNTTKALEEKPAK